MSQFTALFVLHLRQFLRDPFAAAFSFVFPLLFLVSMGLGQTGGKAPPLHIVIAAPSDPAWSGLPAVWSHEDALNVTEAAEPEAMAALTAGRVDAVIRHHGDSTDVAVVSGRTGIGVVVAEHMELALQHLANPRMPYRIGVTEVPIVRRSRFAFVAPGIMALALLQLGLYGTGNQILMARARGLLRRLACTPLSTRQILAAHIAVRLIVAVIQVVMLLAIAHWAFRFPLPASLLLLGIPLLLGATTLSLLGYFIGMTARSQYSGGLVLMLVNMFMIFFGQAIGDSRHEAVTSVLSYLNPLSYLADSFRQVLTGETGGLSFLQNQLILVLWALVFVWLTLWLYRPFQEDR